ncbi:MAG: isoprenyl transferase [Fibromonadales bacterium]|nr:isoprenyl transferase [Fibromonadales bacterium]
MPSEQKKIKHIAVIMDGNGRWAKSKGLERFLGHRHGTRATVAVVEAGVELGLEHLTLFVFSSENWQRPTKEVEYLMNLLVEMIAQEVPKLMENNVKMCVIGNINKLPETPRKKLLEAVEQTSQNSGMQLNLAISYGGRAEIVDAAREIAELAQKGEINLNALDEAEFARHLYLRGAPDPDLIIRTGGEYRLSNYLLWQAAYSEFFVSDVLWPNFTKEDFAKAIEFYNTRQRRFGKVV